MQQKKSDTVKEEKENSKTTQYIKLPEEHDQVM